MLWTADSVDITADGICWTADGYNGCEVPPVTERPPPGGRGSGPTNGVREEYGYRPNYQDELDQLEKERIKLEDDEILDFIKVILTKGLL